MDEPDGGAVAAAPLLDGIRVVDLTRVLAGPYCTQILGDFGADVIKVEEPGGGDEVRRIAPNYPGGESHYFLSLNRNKRSVVVDLKAAAGRDFVLELVRTADVVIENFRPGVMDRLGLGMADLRAAKPDIIMCSITGYGSEGPLSAAPAFDLVIQARSGAMSINGDPDAAPTKLGLPIGDLGGGFWAAIAILAALNRRAGDPQAQHIDVSLLNGLMAMLGYLGQLSMLTGQAPERFGSDHHNVVPYGRFEAKDGHLVVAVLVPQFWRKFCNAVGRPELADDPRFAQNVDRRDNRAELAAIVNDILRQRTRAEWDEIFSAADVPHGPVLDVSEALAQDQVAAAQLLTTVQHPTAGEVQVVGSPIRIDGQRPTSAMTAAPQLGEHPRRIASHRRGMDEADIDLLFEKGVLQ